METVLLQTKLYPPQVSAQMVARPHLLQRLNQYQQRPLTLLSASAGYGKSTLVSAWLETVDTPNAWLSLDEYDDDLPLFLTYFIAAVQTIFPDALPNTQALVGAANVPPSSVLTRTLVSEIQELTQPFILVLDDLHVIHQPHIHDLLNELFRYPSRAMHLVVITRRDPPLPITKMRARAQLTEIRSLELRFTEAETAVFLQQMGIEFEDTAVADLTRNTEGWVTGLRLSALSLRHRGAELPLTQAPQNTQYVTNYLVAETLSELPAEITAFLLQTSILDRLCGSLCDAICNNRSIADSSSETTEVDALAGSQAILQWLYEQNLFIIPLDDQHQWYRYHHLFQELLQTQLTRNYSSDVVKDLHRRASKWLSQADLIDEAIRHSFLADDTQGAVDIVENNTYAILEDGQFSILARWLNQIPDSLVQQRPKLLLARAWVSHFQGSFENILPILQKLDEFHDSESMDSELEGDLDFFNGVLSFWDWQPEPSMQLFYRALAQMPRANLGGRNEAELYLACAMHMAGQGEMAGKRYQQMLRDETSDSSRKGYLLATLAFVYLLSGKLGLVYDIAQEMVAYGERANNTIINGWGSYLMGHVQYEWNNLETAVSHFTEALQKRFSLDINTPIDCYAGLMLTYQALQQPEKAVETVEQMVEFAQQTSNPLHAALAHSVQARLFLLQGDLFSASRRLEAEALAADEGTMFFWIELPRITQCRLLIAQGSETSLPAAAEKLQSYWQLCHATHNAPRMLEILLLQAETFYQQSMLAEAKLALEKAIQLGKRGGYIRPFVELNPALIKTLNEFYNQGIAPNYLKNILKECNVAMQRPTQNHSKLTQNFDELLDPLTRREQDVLGLLAKRFTNKEIAEQLFISPLTVKKYTINIYNKLDVQNRRQAADKAITLGLVPETY